MQRLGHLESDAPCRAQRAPLNQNQSLRELPIQHRCVTACLAWLTSRNRRVAAGPRPSSGQCSFTGCKLTTGAPPVQGYGKRIMFGIEVWVAEQKLPLKISATVDAAQTRLIAFYESLGAVKERNSAMLFFC